MSEVAARAIMQLGPFSTGVGSRLGVVLIRTFARGNWDNEQKGTATAHEM
jgi:hypothetical protein